MAAENSNDKLVFSYWPTRGLAQPIRHMLAYGAGPDGWVDKAANQEEWFGVEKPAMGPLANLPYLKDGEDFVLTESWAISTYVAGKYGLLGNPGCAKSRARVDQAAAFFRHCKWQFAMVCYASKEDYPAKKAKWLESELQPMLKRAAELLGKEKKWFVEDKLSWADFEAYEFLYVNQCMENTCLQDFPELGDFVERFEELPQIKEYMNKDGYIARPINSSVYAQFW